MKNPLRGWRDPLPPPDRATWCKAAKKFPVMEERRRQAPRIDSVLSVPEVSSSDAGDDYNRVGGWVLSVGSRWPWADVVRGPCGFGFCRLKRATVAVAR